MNEQAFEYIRNIRLIDDSFFEVFFKGDPKCIEVVIHEIFKQLGHPLVRIQEVSVQEDLNALDKWTVRLDALATDEEGNLINIEVQQSVSSVLTKRARYHSAPLDTNNLETNSGFDALAETYVIFLLRRTIGERDSLLIKSKGCILKANRHSETEPISFSSTVNTEETTPLGT